MFVSANTLGGKKEDTKFSVVRYGNVIDSRGSVIPLFKKLYNQKKKSLPITDENMTRFFIDITSGIEFVLKSFERMYGGEIFVPKLPSLYIKDIVKALDENLKYHIVGIRPGEKLHEALCIKDESHLTIEFKDHYVIEPTIWEENVNVKTYLKNKLGETGKKVKGDFEYNSFTNKDKLNTETIRKLLKKFLINNFTISMNCIFTLTNNLSYLKSTNDKIIALDKIYELKKDQNFNQKNIQIIQNKPKDKGELIEVYEYCNIIYKKLLEDLSLELNRIHGLKKTQIVGK